GVQVLFSALPSGTAGPFETACARRGIAVFTNAADHRLDPDVPLLVPEVNLGHLCLLEHRPKGRAPIVANPNCTTTGLVVALAPLRGLLRPRSVHVASYQAISGAGYPGVPSLSIADNVVPFIPEEEEKVAQESARILGRAGSVGVTPWKPAVLAQCARVNVREGHLEAVTVESRSRASLEELVGAFRKFDPLSKAGLPTAPHPPVIWRPQADRPQPLRDRWAGGPGRTRGMAVVVGRLRWTPPYLRFFLLSHNAVRGGAGGSVLNAEAALREGYLGPPGRRPGR
ncbi:MAG: aspartate-semialdehyde dehydrogenase, partial [Thermoplasmata archaeon]|nr:aspartate-semialdehyde dehydrogenase [Thermoplasmata archaeon]